MISDLKCPVRAKWWGEVLRGEALKGSGMDILGLVLFLDETDELIGQIWVKGFENSIFLQC